MTRGKYARRSALRREDQSVQAELGTYQRSIKKLTAEKRELQDKIAAIERNSRQEIRTLKAQLSEGLTPELAALNRLLDEERDARTLAEGRLRELRKKWEVIGTRLMDLLEHELKIDREQAIAMLANLAGSEDNPVVYGLIPDSISPRTAKKLGMAGTEAIARARGMRKLPDTFVEYYDDEKRPTNYESHEAKK